MAKRRNELFQKLIVTLYFPDGKNLSIFNSFNCVELSALVIDLIFVSRLPVLLTNLAESAVLKNNVH